MLHCNPRLDVFGKVDDFLASESKWSIQTLRQLRKDVNRKSDEAFANLVAE